MHSIGSKNMATTSLDLFRSVNTEQFPNGTMSGDKPAPSILYPDFEDRVLRSGKIRLRDVTPFLEDGETWVPHLKGTSLFDRKDVFKPAKFWLNFTIPEGTKMPGSLIIRNTGYNETYKATHYQIESRARKMRLDSYKGALDNLARNAVERAIELATAFT
jgi:hypothetical protein